MICQLRWRGLFVIPILSMVFLVSCEERPDSDAVNVVEVTATDHAFQAPNEVSPGWTTFRLNNEMAENIHELSIAHLPEGVSIADYMQDFVLVWQDGLDEFNAGNISADEILDRVLPRLAEWGGDVVYFNSRGLVSSGNTAYKTVYLEPGEYVIDCWVKTEDGQIHAAEGMARQLTVTEEDYDESAAPRPDYQISVTSEGIDAVAELSPGTYHFELHLEESADGMPVYDNVHLIKMDEDTDLEEVARWLNYYQVDGLRSPEPALFYGGVSTYGQMPQDGTAYFGVQLDEPGHYAWVVETPPEEELWMVFEVE